MNNCAYVCIRFAYFGRYNSVAIGGGVQMHDSWLTATELFLVG